MCVNEFIRVFDQVLSDTALRDEVNYGKEQERLVRCAIVCAPNVAFFEISLSRFLDSLLNLFRPFDLW